MLPNLPQVIYYGILWAGGAAVPLNPLFKAREVAHALDDSGAKVLFAWDGLPGRRPRVRPGPGRG